MLMKFIAKKVIANKVMLTLSYILYFIIATAYAEASDEQQSVNKAYVIGTEDIQYYPHYGKKIYSSLEFSGFARELLDIFSKSTQIDFNYKPLPINRLYAELITSQIIDFKYPDNPNWQTLTKDGQELIYSQPISYYIDGTFVHKDSEQLSIDNIRSIGVIRGFTPEVYLEKIRNKKIFVYEYSRSDDLIKALMKKRIDAIYINVDVGNYQLDKLKANVVWNNNLPYIVGNYHLSTIHYPEVIDRLNLFLSSNEKLIKGLIEKYKLLPVTAFKDKDF